MKICTLKTFAMCTALVASIGAAKASGEWPLPFGANLDLSDKLSEGDKAQDYDLSDEKLGPLDMKVTLTYTSTAPGSWRVTAKWGTSKSADRVEDAPDKFEFCRVDTYQRGNKGGLSELSHTARSVTLRLYTRGGSFYDQYGGWQEGWYDITWISDNANKTHRDAHGCV
ncbi:MULTISPECIES: hypothetical protein [Vibrio]|uniref:hypothetical protein n=1 Tax=Vibrio TaxID=662 RepID=UPI001122D42D|nr:MULTISPECIES: hypothetical protein [Vibrio]MCK8064654.1 hypothetical protein [Vibrio sp. 1CM7H]TOO35549.1 hypothetical protein CGH37_14245 [Vibrio parahaemolyticus]TOO42403.1 hypothetical protein CGH36_18485 [Vibrio parahaemolyticus]